jgi:phage gp36-like protein
MPYSIKSDIQKEISDQELIGLTDDEGTGVMNDGRITEAIAGADALIDSYCGAIAEVPFTTVPAIIKHYSITIAIYFLFLRRSQIPEARKKSYDDAIAHLKDISKGIAVIGVQTTADFNEQVKTDRTSEDRKMTMGKDSDGSSGTLDNY